MPAYRCSLCAINYPIRGDLSTCRVCGSLCTYMSYTSPDEDWDREADRQESIAEEEILGVIDMGDEVVVLREDDQLFLPFHLAYRAGIRYRLNEGQVFSVLVHGIRRYYEVLGYHTDGRRYWVREFRMQCPDTFPEEWLEG